MRHAPADAVFALSLAAAAAYELTPVKRWALNRCHRTSPLPPSGALGVFGVARFGWLSASGCIASCWAAMLAMLLATVAQPLVMGAMTAATTYQRLTWRPLTGRRRVAIGYAALAAVFMLAAA
jgi:predicted metal-binding membrane protein